MESKHDIKIEALNDLHIERYKKISFINNEHDLRCVFHVLGKELVIEKLIKDQIGFYLDDLVITLDEIQGLISKNDDIAYGCLFGGEPVNYHVKQEAERMIDELIADYEVAL